jgi:hypothetical protein
MVRAATRFHAHPAHRQVGEKRGHLVTLELFFQHRLTSLIDPSTWIMFFAKSIPIVVIFFMVASPGLWNIAIPLWHSDAV